MSTRVSSRRSCRPAACPTTGSPSPTPAAGGNGGRAAGPETLADDPYRYLPTLSAVDLHLISEGRHEQLWKVLGAHVRTLPFSATSAGPVTGTSFAVWAPNAKGVRVIADFNGWDGQGHPMRSLGGSGVWELFVPGAGAGTTYKYEICGPDGVWRAKADPMAQSAELPPATASVVYASQYRWGDGGWLAARAERDQHREPMSTYEVHLGSWRPGLSYRELADELTDYVTGMGFTHVELLPVAEYPYGGSWGYQVSSYYAPTARFGTPDDFRYLVDRLHQAGVGIIIDWVPAHFPRDDWALARFDGTALYEHADPRRGEHPDWGTLVFDYGRAEVRNFLVANAVYWLEEYHIDGLRVDAVASMLYLDYSRYYGQWAPNAYGGRENLDAIAFLQEVNATAYRRAPGIAMIAEESTAWPGVSRPVHLGGLGFGFKWNMGWMHDTLEYLKHDPIFRHYHQNDLSFSLLYAYTENFVLPLSHDEVVHGKGSLLGKMPGDEWRQFAACARSSATCGRTPARSCCSWGRSSARSPSGPSRTGSSGGCSRTTSTAARSSSSVTSTGRTGPRRPCGSRTARRRGSPGSTPTTRAATQCRSCGSPIRAPGCRRAPGWPANRAARPANLPAGRAARPANRRARPAGPAGEAARPGPAVLACIANFSATPHTNYRVGLPFAGRWRELINTDAPVYGGSGIGNLGMVEAVPEPWHGKPASARLAVPPLGVLWLVPDT